MGSCAQHQGQAPNLWAVETEALNTMALNTQHHVNPQAVNPVNPVAWHRAEDKRSDMAPDMAPAVAEEELLLGPRVGHGLGQEFA